MRKTLTASPAVITAVGASGRRQDGDAGVVETQLDRLAQRPLQPELRARGGLARAWAGNQFRTVAEPHLRQLHEQTGETVHLGVLKGLDVIYLDKVESRQAVRMHSQIGNASPAYCTGVGKAALAALPDMELDKLISTISFRRHTEHTLTSLEALRGEIAEIRQTGIAFDRQEHEPGIHCIAAPIHSRDRDFVAGISTTAPAYRISIEQLTEWAPLVRAAAGAIMEDMTSRLGPKS